MASTKTIIPMSEQFPGRVSWKTSLTKIAQKFAAMDLMGRVLKTQFQYLFRAPNVQFSGTILHQMLLRKSSSNSKEMKFLVNGKEICFDMKQYAMITGLNFGRFPMVENMGKEDKECSPLMIKYFNNNMTVRIADFESSFLSCSDKEDAWKLGLVCLICQYLFTLDPRTIVNIKIIRMVEDIDTFLQFPWGKVSFRATLMGLNKDMKHYRRIYLAKKQILEGKKKGTIGTLDAAYNVYGFALAFQIWTYEVIKTFVPKFVQRTKLHEHFCPRILLYRSIKKNSVKDIITALKGNVVTNMKEYEEEKILYSGVNFEEMRDNIFEEYFEANWRKRKHEEVVSSKSAKRKLLTPPTHSLSTATPSNDSSSTAPVHHHRETQTSGDSSSTAHVQHQVTPTAPQTDAYYSVGGKLDELTKDVKEIKTDINEINTKINLIKENQLLLFNQMSKLLAKIQESEELSESEEYESESEVEESEVEESKKEVKEEEVEEEVKKEEGESEQTILLTEIPRVIAEELELETAQQEGKLVQYLEVNQSVSDHDHGAGQNNDKQEQHANGESSHGQDNQVVDGHADTWEEAAHSNLDCHSNTETNQDNNTVENQTTEGVNSIQNSGDSTGTEVVELSDDDDDDCEMETVEIPEHEVWHYFDLQGVVQGPFSLVSLKLWYDFNYFPSNFVIWKTGENRNHAVLLVDVIRRVFTSK